MAFPTVATVISRAAKQLGLRTADIADPFAETDASIVQMLELLADAGREIARQRDWTVLQTLTSFNTVNGQAAYPLPGDFRRMIAQSGWNRTTRFPLGGPMSPQEWEYLLALPSAQTLTVLFRPLQQNITLYPTPGATVATIAYEYLTSFWVAVTGSTTPSKSQATVATDVLLFDELLLVRAVKLAWKREKGLDVTAAQQDYDAAMQAAEDDDTMAPVLRIDGKGSLRNRLLDDLNVPSTGFGQ